MRNTPTQTSLAVRRVGVAHGFTLVEIILVISIIGVISVIAWGSLRSQLPRYRLVRAANDLAEDVASLRMLAINSNLETRFLVERLDADIEDPVEWGGAWRLQAGDSSRNSSSWEDLPVDAREDGSDDLRGEGSVDIGPGGNRESKGVGLHLAQELGGPSYGNENAIVFTPRGWVANPAEDFDSNGYITFELVNKPALKSGRTEAVHVRIARSGYVRLESTAGHELSTESVGTARSSTHGT
jgi:prepilin-type N-terminal cleavage/methylation domain-containing protein